MIYIVHGDDLSKSRELILNQQKKLGVETRIELNLIDITPNDLFSFSHGKDLFGKYSFIVMNVSGTGKLNLESYIEVLKGLPEETVMVILSDKSLPSTNIFIKNSAVLKAKIISNQKTPKSNIFKFIDALFTKQRSASYNELYNLMLDDTDPYEIFSMILWNLRNISSAKFQSPSFLKTSGFIKSKSLGQAKLFTELSLQTLFKELSILDRESKTGVIEPSMLVPLTIEKVLES